MALNQNDSEFFRPLWRRVAVIAVVAAWFGFEVLFSRDQLWMALTGIALVYAVWNFIIRWPKDHPVPAEQAAPADEPPSDPPKA
jgi:hypothetical protein